ncbi:hypothetical protein E3Q14_01954 [Wallemia mellicola]|nr:hypothetical protein E3Q14_01954 [Wallemia mellicola]TIC59566.1 hypothetical protein E3Q05_00199 [Wallemia mellicola]
MSQQEETPRSKYAGFDQEQDVEGDDYYDDDADFGGDEYPDEQDQGEEQEQEQEQDGDEGDENDGEAPEGGEGDDGEEVPDTPAPDAATPAGDANTPVAEGTEVPVKRGRGRPRGRPKGSGRGLSTPRGTPSGRPRGRGRGRGRGSSRNKDRAKGIGRMGNRRRDEDGTEEINFGYIPPDKPAPRVLRTIGGNEYWYTEDELEIDDDVRGDQKIDEHGGRCYKMPTFTSSLRHDREKVYMLSIDAARGAGYKDSLYMFRRNLLLVKLTLEQEEKERLITEGKLAANSRSRSVTIVAARNVYKLFGAKVLVNGKHVEDDYYEDKARKYCAEKKIEPGTICQVEDEGQFEDADLAALTSQGPNFGTKFLSRAIGGWASDIGAALFSPATTYATKRALLSQNITPENWMDVYAREVQGTNDEINYLKRLRMEESHAILVKAENAGVRKNKPKQNALKKEDEDVKMEGVETPAYASIPPTPQVDPTPSGSQTPTIETSKKKKEKHFIPIEPKFQDVATKDLGRLDPYTNTPHRSMAHQPTNAVWEKVSIGPQIEGLDPNKQYIGGSKLGTQGFSLASISWELDGMTLSSDKHMRNNVTNTPINSSILDLDITY